MSTTSSKNFTTLYSGAGSVVPQGAYGNANVVSLLAAGTDGANTVTTISATGNIVTDAYFVGNFAGNITGNVSVPGANTQVLYNNQGNIGTTAGFTFVNTTGELDVPGAITAVGNVQGNYFLGNGSQLTGLPATYGNANVTTLLAALGSNTISSTGNITTTANVSGGFILGNGSQLTGLPATYGNANVAGFMAAFGANTISSTGNITTTANIAGGYILGNGSQLTGLPATYGNANVANFLANFGSNTVATTGNITGGNISAAGNVNISGQGINVPGGFVNATNHIAWAGQGVAFGSYNTGNTSGNALVYADGANGIVQIYNPTVNNGWIFNSSSGNLTLPGNASAINYANGVSILTSAAGTYGNANVADFLANGFGSNTVTTTGNITAGNVNTTGNIGSTQQTIIGTANATASATGNVVVSGKNIATDVVFVPDASTTTTPTGGRILIGSGIAGNTSIQAWDPSNVLRGPRVAIMDSYAKNNAAVVSGALTTYAAVSLDGNITAAGSRVHGITSWVNVSGGAAGNTYLTSGGGAQNNGLNAISGVLNIGGSNPNLVTQIGANITTRYATATNGILQFYGNGTVVGNAYGHISSFFNNATGNISIANVAAYGVTMVDVVTTTANVGNTIGYLFPDTSSTQFGLGGPSASFLRGNLYAFMNAGNLAQVRLGSTIEQHYYAYPIPTTTGNVTINAVNGQVQTVTPTGAMAITDVTNLITGAFNSGTSTTIPQSQSVTVQIRQGATGYAVTLPTTLGGGPVAYADGFNTVSSAAFATTLVTFTQSPVSGGTPFYAEVKSSDAGGGAAGDDGLIQFNIGGASLTGGRLGAAGSLFWSNSTQTLQTQNCNVVVDLNAYGNINGGTLSTGGTISAAGNVTGGNLRTGGSVSATGNITGGNIITTGTISSTGNVTVGNLTVSNTSSLGSITSYNLKQYTTATTGTVNIDKNNGQTQYMSLTGNVTIGSFQNFVTSQGGSNQSDTVTLFILQGSTPYYVSLPPGRNSGSGSANTQIYYAGGITNVGTTANTVTTISIAGANIANSAGYLVSVSPGFV